MKFTVSKSDLLSALTIAGKCIGKNVLPALENYLFKIKGNVLEVTGSNIEIYISTSIEVVGDFEKSIIVPATRIMGLVKELPNVTLYFELKEKSDAKSLAAAYNLTMKAEKGVYVIPCDGGEDFPRMENKGEISFFLNSDHLLRGIQKTLFATDKANPQDNIGGVLFGFENDEITYTATDKGCLSTLSFPVDVMSQRNFIVPAKVLSILQGLPFDEEAHISLDERSIVLKINESTVVKSLLIDSRYPDYKAVLVSIRSDRTVKVPRLPLLAAVKRVSQFCQLAINAIRFEVSGSVLSVSAYNDFSESAKEEVACELTGDPLHVWTKSTQVITILGLLEGDDVYLYLSGSMRPLVYKSNNETATCEKNLMLTMPMKMDLD